MRYVKIFALLLAGLLLLGGLIAQLFKVQVGERLFDRAIERQLSTPPLPLSLPDGLHVVLVGSGSPIGDPSRMGPSTAVIAGGRIFIVDVGSGSPRNLGRFGVPAGMIQGILITHFHSDHIDSLGELMMNRWVGAAHKTPVAVYGPNGIEKVVDGFNAAYSQDAVYRTAHHSAAVAPPSGKGGVAKPFNAISPTVILEDASLKITAFPVSHSPVEPAVGYRFDYKDRSVTLTGDTAYSMSVIDNAKDTDLLVSEVLNAEMVKKMEEAMAQRGVKNFEKIMSDIPDYHVTPVEAAEMAEKAGAGMLVFSHIVPAVPIPYLEAYYTKGTKAAFDGKIIVGRDGMVFTLPAGSDKVIRN